MSLPHAKVETFEAEWQPKEETQRQRDLLRRLSDSHASTLRLLWGELESLMGMRSSLAAQQNQLMASSVKSGDRAKVAQWWDGRDFVSAYAPGCVRVAHGVSEPTMLVKPTQSGCTRKIHGGADKATPWGSSVELVTEPLPAEAWADPRNRKTASRCREARQALTLMHSRGQASLVVVLYRMYGVTLPPTEFPAFGDLAPIIFDTPTVQRHAKAMTVEIQADPPHASWTVTARTAAHDILDRRSGEGAERTSQRKQAELAIAREAGTLLAEASDAYRDAIGAST